MLTYTKLQLHSLIIFLYALLTSKFQEARDDLSFIHACWTWVESLSMHAKHCLGHLDPVSPQLQPWCLPRKAKSKSNMYAVHLWQYCVHLMCGKFSGSRDRCSTSSSSDTYNDTCIHVCIVQWETKPFFLVNWLCPWNCTWKKQMFT